MGFFDDEADEELEDELEERTGYSMFELERMSRAERNRIIKNAGLDPDDYDFDYDDFHITLREDCGENFIVGALKKAGLD